MIDQSYGSQRAVTDGLEAEDVRGGECGDITRTAALDRQLSRIKQGYSGHTQGRRTMWLTAVTDSVR